MELKRRTPEEREAYLLDQVVNLQSALAAATAENERLRGELFICQNAAMEAMEVANQRLSAKDAMLAAATRFTYGRVTIRYEDDAKKWMVWKNGQSLTDDWFISHDEAYQAALAGGWLEPKNERGGG